MGTTPSPGNTVGDGNNPIAWKHCRRWEQPHRLETLSAMGTTPSPGNTVGDGNNPIAWNDGESGVTAGRAITPQWLSALEHLKAQLEPGIPISANDIIDISRSICAGHIPRNTLSKFWRFLVKNIVNTHIEFIFLFQGVPNL